MEKVTVKCKTAVSGNVRAELLWSNEPISFWGTVDPQSGLIRDNRHPNYMQNMSGKVFAFPTPKGSSGTGLIILEQVRTHCASWSRPWASIGNCRVSSTVLNS